MMALVFQATFQVFESCLTLRFLHLCIIFFAEKDHFGGYDSCKRTHCPFSDIRIAIGDGHLQTNRDCIVFDVLMIINGLDYQAGRTLLGSLESYDLLEMEPPMKETEAGTAHVGAKQLPWWFGAPVVAMERFFVSNEYLDPAGNYQVRWIL